MREEINVSCTRPNHIIVSGITFAQTPYWFPFYSYKDLKMDIIKPMEAPGKGSLHPLFVWIGGGGFQTMERAAFIPWLTEIARRGFVVASIEYRMSNCAKMPAQLQDAKAAVRYLRAHAQMYGIDPEKVAVGGESAGGYLAAMTGTTNGDARYEEGEYMDYSSRVDAVVDFYGPASFQRTVRDPSDHSGQVPRLATGYNPLLGFDPEADKERAMEFEPVSRVSKDTPPFFMAHGTADQLVGVQGSEDFYQRLSDCGVPVEYYVVQGAGHMGPEFYQDEMTEKVLAFLKKALKI